MCWFSRTDPGQGGLVPVPRQRTRHDQRRRHCATVTTELHWCYPTAQKEGRSTRRASWPLVGGQPSHRTSVPSDPLALCLLGFVATDAYLMHALLPGTDLDSSTLIAALLTFTSE
ncbi:hypothetical protein OH77DRAFT_1022586 [Trametes cingulata]|nr:hypothetical protein OH77DRAFT_1022586 [Trametes cingulata]